MGYQDNRSRFDRGREQGRYGGQDRSQDYRADYDRPYDRNEDDDRSAFSYGRDRDQNDRQNYGLSRDDDRGFFERAGEQVRQWFSDDDNDGRNRQQRQGGDDRYGGTWSLSPDRDHARQDRQGTGRFGSPSSYDYRPNRDSYGSNQQQSGNYDRDPGYTDWRNRQMQQLDRDYDEYRQHNQKRFDTEFSSWRTGRQSQRESLNKVSEHMEVVGSDGEKIGTVDKVRGDRIVLTKNDPEAGGHHHSIPSAWIETVDSQVKVSKTADEAKQAWRDEERDTPYGSDSRNDQGGPHNLNRAFSGTY